MGKSETVLTRKKIVAFAILLLAPILNIQEAIGPSTVDTTTSDDATLWPDQRKSFYANGRFWVFYSDGTNVVYRTSTDGTSWSGKTTVRSDCNSGEIFSIWFDGTYFHYAYCKEEASAAIYYRRGTPNSDGTVTWSADEQTAVTGSSGVTYYQPTIATDDSGYPWIGYRYVSGSTKRPYVTKSSSNTGTWSTASGFPVDLTGWNAAEWVVVPVPLTSGKMLVLYNSFGRVIYARQWTGSSWGYTSQTSSATGEGCSNYYSAVNEGDNVHLVFANSTSIVYTKYTYSSHSFSPETKLKTFTSQSEVPPIICRDSNTNNLYVFWASDPTNNHIYYKKCVGGSWDSSPTDWINEATDKLTYNETLTCFYNNYGAYVGLVYMTKQSSPYNVRFAYIVCVPEYPYGQAIALLLCLPVYLMARFGLIDRFSKSIRPSQAVR